MANPPSLIMSYIGNPGYTSFPDTNQDFWSIVQTSDNNFSNETEAQAAFLAGTASKLQCNVTTATTTGTSTMVLRINKANGTMSVSIPATQTGIFIASGQDTINNGDLVCYGITAGDTNLVITVTGFTFTATVDTNTKLGILQTFSVNNSTTYYFIPSGFIHGQTTESIAKLRLRKAMAVKNISWYVSRSSTGTASAVSRKNGANGNFSFTINGGSNTLLQDTTHSDSLSVGDDYNFQITGGSTATNFTLTTAAADFTSSNGDCIFVCGYDGLTSLNTSTTNYYGLSGSLDTLQTTEANTKFTVNSAFLFSQLTCNVITNPITSATTIKLRANAANPASGPALSFTGTGLFNDNTNTYQAATTDVMDYQVITGSTGSNGLAMSFIEVYGNATAGAAASGPVYQNFGSFRRIQERQNYQSFGQQMVIFG